MWSKPWYRKLAPLDKCAFFYILGNCDAVGVWDGDLEVADFMIGIPVDWGGLIKKCNGNIKVMENGKWWLPDFCTFQYGNLDEECQSPAIKSHIRLLKKHSLWQGYGNPTVRDKDKDKEQEKVKDKEKEKEKSGIEAKECLDYYFATHKEVRGYEPTIVGGRDIKLFKTLLKNYDVPAVKEVIQTFFGWDKRSDFTTRALYNKFDTLYGVLKDKAEGKR